jgi:hypothetical protein
MGKSEALAAQGTSTSPSAGSLTRDMLEWIANGPRTYAETMDVWRSSCPRLTIWEDALADGLIRVENSDPSHNVSNVVLTPKGIALIESPA